MEAMLLLALLLAGWLFGVAIRGNLLLLLTYRAHICFVGIAVGIIARHGLAAPSAVISRPSSSPCRLIRPRAIARSGEHAGLLSVLSLLNLCATSSRSCRGLMLRVSAWRPLAPCLALLVIGRRC